MTIPTAQRPLRIFVLEDHADTLACLKSQLEKAGHTVTAASTLEEAVSLLPASHCEVLLSDIGLPDGSGWDLLQRTRPLPQELLMTVAMSGYGDRADRTRSVEAGFQHHLTKPFRKADLLELLRNA
jgi:two-component system CheB/CheR fusion protein